MCGITGILSLNGSSIDPRELQSLTSALAHRGPDGQKTFISRDGRVGLGHTRLAIIDPKQRSDQPLVSSNGRFVITFNGEIYNFLELRAELEHAGVTFRTQGDTEVLLEGFAKFGHSYFERINGMWAALIWDNEKRTLIATRDRFGVKPLYYFKTKNFTFFSSETVAFRQLNIRPQLDEYEISIAISDPYYLEAAGRTIYRNVSSIKAGETAKFCGSAVEVSSWWNLSNHETKVAETYEERCEEFKELFLTLAV